MRNLLFFCLLSFFCSVSSVWIPRYDPCQLENDKCVLGDFKLDENETTCRTIKRTNYGWNTRKSCITFIQKCESIEEVEKIIYHRINCDKIVNADIKLECEKWKVTEYCTIDWWHVIPGFILAVLLITITCYCVCLCGNKSDEELNKEDIAEAQELLSEVQKNYESRIKRF